jgi:hypothetical protein
MKTRFASFQILPVTLALAAGALCAPPLLAQTRAAFVQSVDEPGRNPYQESLNDLTCRNGKTCAFNFATVPAGKRLVLTHISGYVDTGAGTLPSGFVQSDRGGSAYATLAFTGERGSVGGLGTRIFINHNVLAYFGPGESVRGVYTLGITSSDFMSGGAAMMLTGYYVNLP